MSMTQVGMSEGCHIRFSLLRLSDSAKIKLMKEKSPLFELGMAIAWGLLGIVFLYYGFKSVGALRLIYLLFGVIDIMVAARYFIANRKKK